MDVGTLALLRGRAEEALAPLRESLAISLPRRGGSNAWSVFFAVALLAALAAAVGRWQRSTRLAGAADGFVAPFGGHVSNPTTRTLLETSRAAASEHLGEESFARAWAEGQAMTIDQAGEYALKEDAMA